MKMRLNHLLIEGNCTKGGRPYKDPKQKKKNLKAEAAAGEEAAVGSAETRGESPRQNSTRGGGP